MQGLQCIAIVGGESRFCDGLQVLDTASHDSPLTRGWQLYTFVCLRNEFLFLKDLGHCDFPYHRTFVVSCLAKVCSLVQPSAKIDCCEFTAIRISRQLNSLRASASRVRNNSLDSALRPTRAKLPRLPSFEELQQPGEANVMGRDVSPSCGGRRANPPI